MKDFGLLEGQNSKITCIYILHNSTIMSLFNSTVTNLPPILRRNNEETRIVNNPDLNSLLKQMNDEEEDPIAFIVNKNLVVRVKVRQQKQHQTLSISTSAGDGRTMNSFATLSFP